MDPDRFDDVEARILEAPEPPPPQRGRRWALGLAGAVLAAGALAAGASALGGSGDGQAAPAKPSAAEHQRIVKSYTDREECEARRRAREAAQSGALRY